MAYKFQLGNAVMSGALEQEEGITVESGGLTVTAGGLTVSAGTTALAATTATTVSASTSLSGDSLTLGAYGIATAGVATIASMGGNWTNASRTIADLGTVTTATSITATDLIGTNVDGIIGADTARAGTFAALVGTSLSVGDGNITNVGQIECDTVAPDGAASGLNISFGGNTGTGKLSLADNLADALNVTQGGNSYMKFTTTDSSELITFGKNSTFTGTTINNLGTVSACTSITTNALVAGANLDIGAYEMRALTFESDQATGTAPFTVASTTQVANLNAATLGGADFASPGAIGGTAAGAGNFAALDATGATTLNGNVTLGNATADDVTVTGRVASNVVPKTDSTSNLGSSALRWSTIYVDSIVGANVAFDVETVAGGGTIAAATDFALISSGDATTVTLPDAVAGKALRVKLGNAVGDSILDAAGADTIDGSTTIRLESTGSAVTLVAYDASTWYII